MRICVFFLKKSDTFFFSEGRTRVLGVKIISFFFSDDFVLAKHLFSKLEISLPVQFAESPENYPEETLMLMSQSDAIVISNSSFSWWAAQLGKKSKFVVYPSKWLRGMLDPEDLFPTEWHPQESQWEI